MIAAVVLAAGLSRRMGRPKMTLPWGETTVIGQVVQVLDQAGVDEIVVVDSFSSDRTKSICLNHGVTFIEQEFLGYIEQKNLLY